MTSEEFLLNLSNLSVQSPGGRFRDLSLLGSKGEILLITSTDGRKIVSLFRVLAGLESALSGSIQYNGEKIGLVLSTDELPAWSKIKYELTLFGALNGLDKEIFGHLMESWDLEGTYNLPVDVLSPYEKTAFFLVLETAAKPELLLCQEPLAGLNPSQTRKMLANLGTYAQAGHLVLIGTVNSTNYPAQFRRISLDKVQSVTLAADEPLTLATPFNIPIAKKDQANHGSRTNSASNFLISGSNPDSKQVLPPLKPVLSATGAAAETAGREFGGRTVVTVFVQLPVGPATEYELRRIGEIKYFQSGPTGYEIDVLESHQSQLLSLLAQRGLSPISPQNKEEV